MITHDRSSSSDRKPAGGPAGGPGPVGRRGGPMAMMAGDRAQDFRGTMAKLIQYLSSYKTGILIVMLFAVGSTIFNIAGPKILGEATTKLFEGVLDQIGTVGVGHQDGGAGLVSAI